jgi:hypothetical protein
MIGAWVSHSPVLHAPCLADIVYSAEESEKIEAR